MRHTAARPMLFGCCYAGRIGAPSVDVPWDVMAPLLTQMGVWPSAAAASPHVHDAFGKISRMLECIAARAAGKGIDLPIKHGMGQYMCLYVS